MDELTIENQKYLSSKKSAKLTGYAKDYVGQLCREGRVEARLVGRNWYVLESSIMEHRFGPAEIKKDESQLVEKNVEEYNWKSPIYTPELSKELPYFTEKVSETFKKPAEEEKDSLSDMQSAWQEWFKNQQNKEKALPDASEMLLPEGTDQTESLKIDPEVYINQEGRYEEEAEVDEYVPLIRHREIDVLEETPLESITIVKKIEHAESKYSPRMASESSNQGTEPHISRIYKEETPREKRAIKRQGKPSRKGGFLLQVFFLSLAGLFVATTILATTTTSDTESGSGNALYRFLNGVSTVEAN